MYTGSSLDDNHWHTVHIKRRARRVELRVDKQPVTKGKTFLSSSAQIQKGLIGYCFKYTDRPFCRQTDELCCGLTLNKMQDLTLLMFFRYKYRSKTVTKILLFGRKSILHLLVYGTVCKQCAFIVLSSVINVKKWTNPLLLAFEAIS